MKTERQQGALGGPGYASISLSERAAGSQAPPVTLQSSLPEHWAMHPVPLEMPTTALSQATNLFDYYDC